MHKKLAADLTSLAHSILQMKNKEDVLALKAKAHDVYEKLALLAYVEEYINNTPNITTTKEALIAKIATVEKEALATNKTATETQLSKNTVTEISSTDETSFNETLLVENKDREEIPFSFNEPIEEPFVDDSLTETKNTSLKESIENEIIEQPFDELEDIIFGETPIKDEASFIEETKAPEIDIEVLEETEPIEEVIHLTPEETEPEVILEKTNPIEEVIPHTSEEAESEIVLEETKPIEVEIPSTPGETELEIILEETKPIEEEVVSEEITFTKESKTPTLEEELGDTLSVDVMANLFEKAPVKKTLNDRMFQDTIKIDLNDRIAFVKHLFEGNQEDFNRVVSQLNTLKTEKAAKQFILKMVKPDYDWSLKEDYETRLFEIIERRFS